MSRLTDALPYGSILFFGGSVTAQGGDSGYFTHVESKFSKVGFECNRVAFGGGHIDEAGFYNIEQCLRFQSKYIVFEWNTTARLRYNKKKLYLLFYAFISRKIIPIILILPQRGYLSCNREAEIQLFELAEFFCLHVIDIRNHFSDNTFCRLVRDNV